MKSNLPNEDHNDGSINPALEPFRQNLLAKRKSLLTTVQSESEDALMGSTPEGTGDASTVPTHPADQGTEMGDQDRRLTLVERHDAEIAEIDDALARLKTGTYGICENCDEAVPVARLRAVPEARYCVECQKEIEAYAIEDERMGPAREFVHTGEKTDSDWRVLDAPITRQAGVRDLQNDQRNLYETGAPPRSQKEFEERGGEYNESFGRGGFPSSYYGRDSRPEIHSDEPGVLHADDSGHRLQNDATDGSSGDAYYKANSDEAFLEEEISNEDTNDLESDSDEDSEEIEEQELSGELDFENESDEDEDLNDEPRDRLARDRNPERRV
jgi:DnaK suppressor protein